MVIQLFVFDTVHGQPPIAVTSTIFVSGSGSGVAELGKMENPFVVEQGVGLWSTANAAPVGGPPHTVK
jgi:hypothetical protein